MTANVPITTRNWTDASPERVKYERAFGERYFAPAEGAAKLELLFDDLAVRYGLQRSVAPYQPAEAKQLALF